MPLPQTTVDKIVSNIKVTLIELEPINGNVSELELEILSKIEAYSKPRSIFEFVLLTVEPPLIWLLTPHLIQKCLHSI